MSVERKRVAILFGGRSGEHPISIRSSQFIVESIDRRRYEPVLIGVDRTGGWHRFSEVAYWRLEGEVAADQGEAVVIVRGAAGQCGLMRTGHAGEEPMAIDAVFPVLHGPYGEDGTVQGLLETFDVPYVGVGVLSAAVCMDKDVCKRLLRDAGIPIVPYVLVRAHTWAHHAHSLREQALRLGAPLFVKPASLGSSLGVTRVSETAPATLDAAIATALALDHKVLVERGIEGREIECAVLGNETARASRPGEILPGEAFYSYEDKYAEGSGAQTRVPADLAPGVADKVRALALRAYEALECSGMARVDFFLERATGALYLNEVNTIPGFTSISMYPKMWAAEGIDGPALVTRLIELAESRWSERRRLRPR